MTSIQQQINDWSERSGKAVDNDNQVGKLTPPEVKLLELFPINQMTSEMMDLLKTDVVKQFIRLHMVQKLYGSFPDTKPDPETVLYQYLDFMFSKRFQVS